MVLGNDRFGRTLADFTNGLGDPIALNRDLLSSLCSLQSSACFVTKQDATPLKQRLHLRTMAAIESASASSKNKSEWIREAILQRLRRYKFAAGYQTPTGLGSIPTGVRARQRSIDEMQNREVIACSFLMCRSYL